MHVLQREAFLSVSFLFLLLYAESILDETRFPTMKTDVVDPRIGLPVAVAALVALVIYAAGKWKHK